jgi:diacylglycerol kinase (ATP)
MIRFLVNPAAGRGKSRRALASLRRFASARDADLAVSRDAGDLTAQARRAVADGVDRLVVAGGDGTFHHAAQALVGSGCALGVVSLGRGNDYAADLGVPLKLDDAMQFAVDGPVRSIDAGGVNGRAFTGYCGVGFDGEAARVAHSAPPLFRGPLTYVYSVVRTMLSFRAPVLTVRYQGGEFEGRAMFAIACNISRIGGGMRITPEASFDDGLLDLIIASELGRAELLRVFPKVYRGSHVDHPAVRIVRTPSVSISADRSLTVACDGEPLFQTNGEDVEVSIEPRSLSVVAP